MNGFLLFEIADFYFSCGCWFYLFKFWNWYHLKKLLKIFYFRNFRLRSNFFWNYRNILHFSDQGEALYVNNSFRTFTPWNQTMKILRFTNILISVLQSQLDIETLYRKSFARVVVLLTILQLLVFYEVMYGAIRRSTIIRKELNTRIWKLYRNQIFKINLHLVGFNIKLAQLDVWTKFIVVHRVQT